MQSAEGGVDTAMRCIASCSYSDHQPWTPKTTVEGERVRVRHVARFSGLESLSEYSPHGHQASSCSLARACGPWLPPHVMLATASGLSCIHRPSCCLEHTSQAPSGLGFSPAPRPPRPKLACPRGSSSGTASRHVAATLLSSQR